MVCLMDHGLQSRVLISARALRWGVGLLHRGGELLLSVR
jgi:hypothetical protein